MGTEAPVQVEAPAAPRPSVQSEARLWRWSGSQFNPRRNSLNLLRLVFAFGVLLHHSFVLGGFPGDPVIGGVGLGEWSVLGFFCISGYLIAGSRINKPLPIYMTHRAARILPAFWVCLIVTAFAIAPLEYWHRTGTINGYLTQPGVTPADYVLLNFMLRINSFAIGNSLHSTPFPSAWDGSLWTLYYEFLCYVLLGALFMFGWWRRSALPTVLAFALSVIIFINTSTVMSYLGGNPHAQNFIHFLPYFLGGACIQMLRPYLPIHWAGAVLSGIAVWALVAWSPLNGIHWAAPVITYFLLWVGTVVRQPNLISKNDLSYGVYIYAFPIQQLLVSFGATRFGIAPFILATIAITIVLAALSWRLVERPAMRRARQFDVKPALAGLTASGA